MPKILSWGDEAHRALERGINRVTDTVGSTLGHKGPNVGLATKLG